MGAKGFVVYMGVTGLLLTLLARRKSSVMYSASDFFRPEEVKAIADSLPYSSEDDFIQAAWQYVGSTIPYQAINSDMLFDGKSSILCQDCLTPGETLTNQEGNCLAKSALLASILVTRIPADRVNIIVGKYAVVGGHAWVECQRSDGKWYVLEATGVPKPGKKWVLADDVYPMYSPGVYMTADLAICDDPSYLSSSSFAGS